MIFGMKVKPNKNTRDVVDGLFRNTLGVQVKVVNVECTTPRDNKPAAIKLELESVWDRVSVLKNKAKCNAKKKTANVRIRGCEEHADRVNRLNSMQLLKMIGKDKEFVIVGNGVIKSKAELKSPTNRSSQGNGGGAETRAKKKPGDASADAITTSGEAPRAQVSDNTSDSDASQNNNKPSNSGKSRSKLKTKPSRGVSSAANHNVTSSGSESNDEDEEEEYNSAPGSAVETDTESADHSAPAKSKKNKASKSLERQALDNTKNKDEKKKKH